LSAKKLTLDAETCGFYGQPVLLQHKTEDGPIVLTDLWLQPIGETLKLIEWICEHTVVGFNLAFDWFHLAKIYTTFRLCPTDWIPVERIHEIALKEKDGRDGPCIKPYSALDLMLHSRKGPYQSLMDRDDVRIRRVPTKLAYELRDILEEWAQKEIPGIYFAGIKGADKSRVKVFDRKDRRGDLDSVFKDVVIAFKPAGGLKPLTEHVLNIKPDYQYADVEPPKEWLPFELGYAPYAEAVGDPNNGWEIWPYLVGTTLNKKTGKRVKKKKVRGTHAWPAVKSKFINHWATHTKARKYASDDIVYTEKLDEHFGYPEPGDDDSVLACSVAVVRWHGFEIDLPGIESLKEKAHVSLAECPVNHNSVKEVREHLLKYLDPAERLIPDCAKLQETTNKKVLTRLTQIDPIIESEYCLACNGKGCVRCGDGILNPGPHPVAVEAQKILDAKSAKKEIEIYDKLLIAKRFHASYIVIGTKSNRMAGGDKLNSQGIKKTELVRSKFPLKWKANGVQYVLSGGDFSSYEWTLAHARYRDEGLKQDLMNGVKIAAHAGAVLFPGHTWQEILATDGAKEDLYTLAKSGGFAWLFMGDENTFVRNLKGVKLENARNTIQWFFERYPEIAGKREITKSQFCSITQPGGRSSEVFWAEPAEYIETFLGFRRTFTLENDIVRKLFALAQHPPATWRDVEGFVVRNHKQQTILGATLSALYAACFGLQGANYRAGENTTIQSPGGTICKAVQRKIWDYQPVGVHEFKVAPANFHDEIQCVCHPDVVESVAATVAETVESYREQVPLVGMVWYRESENWAEKKSGEKPVVISYKKAA
jgi:hypothetical protein